MTTRIKIDGMSFSPGQIDALHLLSAGCKIRKDTNSFVLRRFGMSPHSMCLIWPDTPIRGAHADLRVRSKNIHMTCQALLDKKLVESCGYEKQVASSSTYYCLSKKGKDLIHKLP